MYVGTHQSIQDGFVHAVNHAIDLKTNCLQIFVRNPMNFSSKIPPIELETVFEVRKLLKENDIKLFVHANYLYNFCTSPEKYAWARHIFKDEIKMAHILNAEGIVLHMGSSVKESVEVADRNFKENLGKILSETTETPVPILLETPHGKGTKIAGTIEELAGLVKSFKSPHVQLCIDTAHIFYYGYKIDTLPELRHYFQTVENLIGLKNHVGLIHLNDAMLPFQSKLDRHGTVGEGNIFKGNENLVRYIKTLSKHFNIPLILESRSDAEAPEYKYEKELAFIRGAAKQNRKSVNDKELILDILWKLKEYHKAIQKPYEAAAYERAHSTLRRYSGKIMSGKSVSHLPGIGEGIERKIDEILETGHLQLLDDMERNPMYGTLITLQTVDGIGPVFAKELIDTYGVRSLTDLVNGYKMGKIPLNHLQTVSLKHYKDLKKKVSRNEIEEFRNRFEKDVGLKVEIAGSYRTGSDYSSDIDFIVIGRNLTLETIVDKVESFQIVDIVSVGKSGAYLLVRLDGKSPVRHMDVRFVEPEYVHSYLLYFGSGAVFSKWIRSQAKERGYKLNEFGLFDLKNGRLIPTKSEKDIFKKLDLDWVEPRDRV